MNGSRHFQSYTKTLHRVLLVELIDQHRQRHDKRRLSIVGPCHTHEQWLAVQAERRRTNDGRVAPPDHRQLATAAGPRQGRDGPLSEPV